MNKKSTNLKLNKMKQMKTILSKKLYFLFLLLGTIMLGQAQSSQDPTESFCAGTGVRNYAADTGDGANGTPGSTYSWSVTGTNSSSAVLSASTGNPISINWSAAPAGSYIVRVVETITSTGCFASEMTLPVTINALPTATISYASPYCATGTGTVTQTGQTGGTYTSTAGLIIDGTSGDINLTTSTPGTYTVTYTFTNGSCSNTTTASVTINALPTATISYSSPYCATGTGTVTQTGQTGGTYSSTAGLIIDVTTGDINLATSTAGTYLVTYTFTNGSCSNTTTASVTINAAPTATIAYSSQYCATGTGTVTQTGQTGGTYTSTAGLIIDGTSGDINLATSTVGTYTVTYTFTNGFCSNTTTTSVIVNALPTTSAIFHD
jgi:hypothetical protein